MAQQAVTHAPRVGILCNANSRAGSRWLARQLAHCQPFLAEGEAFVSIRKTSTLTQLEEALTFFAAHGVSHLALIGGDGTLDAAVGALRNTPHFKKEPTIALFAAGTTNMSFKDVGFKTAKNKALATFLRSVSLGKVNTLQRAPLKVESATLSTPVYGFFMGLGAIVRIIHHTRAHLHSKGLTSTMGEGVMLLKTLWQLLWARNIPQHPLLAPTSISFVEGGGSVLQRQVVCFGLTSLKTLLLGIIPCQKGEGGIALLGVNFPYGRFVQNILPLFCGKKEYPLKENTGYTSQRTHSLTLAFAGEWTLDGEMFTTTPQTPLVVTTAPPFTFAIAPC